jgi:hypothetical protein
MKSQQQSKDEDSIAPWSNDMTCINIVGGIKLCYYFEL